MGDKNWAHERGIDDLFHRHDPSTPKHNKGRKRLRRAVKRREARLIMKQVDDELAVESSTPLGGG